MREIEETRTTDVELQQKRTTNSSIPDAENRVAAQNDVPFYNTNALSLSHSLTHHSARKSPNRERLEESLPCAEP